MSRTRASAELVVAALIWGFGFIATRWALAAMGPLWIITVRSFVAFFVALPVLLIIPEMRARVREEMLPALPAGVFLAASLGFQTVGLRFTTATNSGFITVLYVLFVPPFAAIFLKQRMQPLHGFFLGIALLGAGFIAQVTPSSSLNVGDVLTLLCAVTGAFHIVWLSHAAKRIASPFVFNALQNFWVGGFALVVAVPLEPRLAWRGSGLALFGLAFLALASTLIAFLLQTRAQRVLPAATASLLCLLESPFAALFAFLLLGERLSLAQWAGCSLVMAASVGAIIVEQQTNA